MAKKGKGDKDKTPQWVMDLYREDLDRVVRGERPMYFRGLEDKPLINEYPEFNMPGLKIAPRKGSSGIVDDALDIYERVSDKNTLPGINRRVGEWIRGLGDRMPGVLRGLWQTTYDMSQYSPDKGMGMVSALPMAVINHDVNERRKENGEYPLGYVSAVDLIWPREKYGSFMDMRTPEEVRQWEIENGTRNAAEVELPEVVVFPENRDRMSDGGQNRTPQEENELAWRIGETVRLAFMGRPVPQDSLQAIIERYRTQNPQRDYNPTVGAVEQGRNILRGLNNTVGTALTGASLGTMGAWNVARLLGIGRGSVLRRWMARNALTGARAGAIADVGDYIEDPSVENAAEVGLSKVGAKDFTKLSNKVVNSVANFLDVKDVIEKKPDGGSVRRYGLGPDYEWIDADGRLGEKGKSYFVDGPSLIRRANEERPNFVQRLWDPDRKTIRDWADKSGNTVATHKLGWEYGDDGRIYVFPEVQEIDGELYDFTDPSHGIPDRDVPYRALESAISNNDYIVVDSPQEAFWFTDNNYKRFYPKGSGKGGDAFGRERKAEGGKTYTVKKGDSLSSIAKSAGVSVKDIMSLNPDIKDPNSIRIGQSIILNGGPASTKRKDIDGDEYDAERWYKAINPGIETSIGSAMAHGKGILERLWFDGERVDYAPEHEEELWKTYLYGGVGDMEESDIRFEGDGEDDADYVKLPELQRKLIESLVDTASTKGMIDKVDFADYPNLSQRFWNLRDAKDDYRVAKVVMENPNEWILLNEGHSPYRLEVESNDEKLKKKGKYMYTGLGGLKNFLVRWNPKDRTLDIKDDFDFKHPHIVEGWIPQRSRPLRIRDRITIPEDSSYIYKHPQYMRDRGYRPKFRLAEGGNIGEDEMERLRDVYDYLRNNDKYKFDEAHALAITANIAAESRGNIDALGTAGDFGLQQWLGPRKAELQRRYGKNPTMENQLDYLIDEYMGNVNGMGWNYVNRGRFMDKDSKGNSYGYYMYSKDDFDNATSYRDAVVAWNQGFGRPLGSTLRNDYRLAVAGELADAWGIEDGEFKDYPYGVREEKDAEMVKAEAEVPSSTPTSSGKVDSWWERNGDMILSSILTNAGATRKMVEDVKARVSADEESKRDMERQREEAERDELKRRVAMSLIGNIRLDIPGMARTN